MKLLPDELAVVNGMWKPVIGPFWSFHAVALRNWKPTVL